jgi:Domain of unknown function (DUF4388)
MTELSGTLDGIGLFPLLNFLGSLKAAGRLTITDTDQSGSLYLTDGHVIGASFGSEQGQVALDAIGLALGNGHFEFADDGGMQPANLELSGPELQQHLVTLQSERARILGVIPSLDSMPVAAMDGPDDQPIALDRASLRLLMRCDGQRNVLDLARESDLLSTLKRLTNLAEANLIRVDMPWGAPQPQPVPEAYSPPPPPPPPPPAAVSPEVSAQDTVVLQRPVVPPAAESPAPAPRRPWWEGGKS